MVCKYNLLKEYNLDHGKLQDRFGNCYSIIVKDGLMYIYNYKKRSLDPSIFYDIGVNVVRINF